MIPHRSRHEGAFGPIAGALVIIVLTGAGPGVFAGCGGEEGESTASRIESAQDFAATSALENAQGSMENDAIAQDGSYAGLGAAQSPVGTAVTDSDGRVVENVPPPRVSAQTTRDTYRLSATSGTGTKFVLERKADGTISGTCTGESPDCHGATWEPDVTTP